MIWQGAMEDRPFLILKITLIEKLQKAMTEFAKT